MSVTAKVHKRTRPRTRPDWLGVVVSDRNFKLSPELCGELCEFAELEERSRRAKSMLFAVTEELSMFESDLAALDHHRPRPAHKVQLLESVLVAAKEDPPDSWIEAAQALTLMAGPLAWEFQREKFPQDADEKFFKKEWPKFARAVLLKLREKESRHGPTQRAKRRLVNELAFIFDTYAELENKEDYETLRAEFVATALTIVGMQKGNPEKLRHKSTSRLARELPEPFTPAMARRRARLCDEILRQAKAKKQSLEAFLIDNPRIYAEYREAGQKIKKS